jgi:hypothetical protein
MCHALDATPMHVVGDIADAGGTAAAELLVTAVNSYAHLHCTCKLPYPCSFFGKPVSQLSNSGCLSSSIHPHNQQHGWFSLQLQLAATAAAVCCCCCWLQKCDDLLLDGSTDVIWGFDLPSL